MACAFVFFLLLLLISAVKSESCKKTTACSCSFNDEVTLNINSMIPGEGFLTAEKNNNVYFYHGCKNAVLKNDTIPKNTMNECAKPSTLCILNGTNVFQLGDAEKVSFIGEDHNITLLYEYNNQKSYVNLICSPELSQTEFYVISPNVFHIFSPNACRIYEPHGLGWFSKLLIMFSVFFLLYMIFGCCGNYFLRGARGKEVIPNVEFWMNVPSKIKEGIFYIVSGCRGRMVSTTDTYDQI